MYVKYQNNISRIWPIYKAYRPNNMVWKQDALDMRVFLSDRAKVVSLYLIFANVNDIPRDVVQYGLDDQTYSNVWYNSCYRYVEPSQWPYGYCNWGARSVYWHIPTLSKSLFQPTAFSVLPEDNTRCQDCWVTLALFHLNSRVSFARNWCVLETRIYNENTKRFDSLMSIVSLLHSFVWYIPYCIVGSLFKSMYFWLDIYCIQSNPCQWCLHVTPVTFSCHDIVCIMKTRGPTKMSMVVYKCNGYHLIRYKLNQYIAVKFRYITRTRIKTILQLIDEKVVRRLSWVFIYVSQCHWRRVCNLILCYTKVYRNTI